MEQEQIRSLPFLGIGGSLRCSVIRGPEILIPGKWMPDSWDPQSDAGHIIKRAAAMLPPDLARELIEATMRTLMINGTIRAKTRCWDDHNGKWVETDYGVVGMHMVDTSGVNFLVQGLIGAQSVNAFKYHGIGTGSTAAAITDTALGTELTTQYTVSGTRATGTQVVGSSNNIYKTVATNLIGSGGPVTIAEWGLFNNATSGAGTLLDRSLVGSYVLNNGDSLATEFDLTLAAGG